MNILLDTHLLIWALNDDAKLPQTAKKMIMTPEHTIYYSVISLWEVVIKHVLRPEKIAFSGTELANFCHEAGYICLDTREKHILMSETLKRKQDAPPHNDPFDKMLIAQAKAEKMIFLTHDRLLRDYEEETVTYV